MRRKKALVLFFFLLMSCSRSPDWSYSVSRSSSPAILLQSVGPSDLTFIDLEFLATAEGIQGFLILRNTAFLSPSETHPFISLGIDTNHEISYFQGRFLKGNKKILLPKEMVEYLLKILPQNDSITLILEEAHIPLSTKGFASCLRHLASLQKME